MRDTRSKEEKYKTRLSPDEDLARLKTGLQKAFNGKRMSRFLQPIPKGKGWKPPKA